jgi:hypothetical protein
VGYNRKTVKSLLTDTEYELFLESLPDRIGDLDKKGLRSGVTRTRRARDKYADLQRRQAGAKRQRAGGRGAALGANERTAQKADIFGEALARFEAQIDKIERAEVLEARRASLERTGKARKKAGATTARGTKKAGTKKKAGAKRTATGFVTEQAKGAHNRSASLGGATAKNINASRKAAGQRRQARRDSR